MLGPWLRICTLLTPFALFSVLSPLASAAKAELSKPLSYYHQRFDLQPWPATIKVNGQLVQPKVYRTEKSFGYLSIAVAQDQRGEHTPFTVEISRSGYRSFTDTTTIAKIKAQMKGKRPVIVLDKKNSPHHFHSYWRTGYAPKSVTFIDNRRLIIPTMSAHGIDLVDIHTGPIKKLPVPEKKYRDIGGFVEALVIPERNELWISQLFFSSLHVYNLTTLEYKKRISVKGRSPKFMLYDKERDLVYVSIWFSLEIAIVDGKTLQQIGTINPQGVPRGLLLGPQGGKLFAGQFYAPVDGTSQGQLLQIDLASKAIEHRYGTPGAKRHIVFGHGRIFVSDLRHNFVEEFVLTKNSANANAPRLTAGPVRKVFTNPNTIALAPDRPWLYVSSRGPNSPDGYEKKGPVFGKLTVFDVKANKTVDIIEGGNQPTGLAISPNGRYIAFTDFYDGAVRVYRRAD